MREAESQIYEGEIVQLKKENASLKDQLQRSLKELRAYQVKFPSAYVSVADEVDGEFPQWSISPESMGPLIQAYDTSKPWLMQ